ncbi:MAG: hypothetical protein JWQ72_60, partial [Polaromonas sp.]|nr:hypothetical protein [Polaromonas sp.]
FNSAAVSMFMCAREDAIGSSFSRFIPERLREGFVARLTDQEARAVPVSGQAAIEIFSAMRSNGDEFAVELSLPRSLEDDITVNTLILRDVTERLLIQEALERSNLDLQQFAFVASHDLKTPLRSINGFIQVLKRSHSANLDDKAKLLIQRTLDATIRLEQLTDDLLSYARLNSDVKPMAPVSCGDAADDAVDLLDAVIRETGAVVTVGVLPQVMGDRIQLVQLFMNLIGNGIKYCRANPPRVHVSASKEGVQWIFSVTDNGIGIDEQHHERIFEVFKRLHIQTEYSGTGIGLAICRRVVEGHGGTIWVASTPGAGSTFSFAIPHINEKGLHDAALTLS